MASPHQPEPYHNQKYEELLRKHLASNTLFEDPFFPAQMSSLCFDDSFTKNMQLFSEIEWLRPGEITDDPVFMADGASRFDIQQGRLGDCWLMAAIAALAESRPIFKCVVPDNQNFKSNYCGLFRFRFWRFGKWVEVCVDDRLPCDRQNGPQGQPKLILMQSQDQNEFWSALLEKAYAKLHGSYQALEGGHAIEAMEDFTGGVSENFDVGNLHPDVDLFDIIFKAQNKGSLLGCSIKGQQGVIEHKLPNGLIMGHAYTITGVHKDGKLKLIRCRNPWGNEEEWKGAWADGSKEWSTVSKALKDKLLKKEDDGEFWMSYEDFLKHWSNVEICNLSAESASDGSETIQGWNIVQHDGRWLPNVSAGGCSNFQDSFWMNPQYLITLRDSDEDDDDVCTVIIALMQKDRRKGRQFNLKMLSIGFNIYKCKPIDADKLRNGKPLPKEWFKHNESCSNVVFSDPREKSIRLKLDPGDYVIIPCTFDPDQRGEFVLRIFAEAGQESKALEEETEVDDTMIFGSGPIGDDKILEERFFQFFKKIAGEDCEIDSWELKDCIDQVLYKDPEIGGFDGFTDDTCKTLVALYDFDGSGKLGFDEFTQLWRDIAMWKAIYKLYDGDKNGSFDLYELRRALKDLGYNLSGNAYAYIVREFGDRDGQVRVNGFVKCLAQLKKIMLATKTLKENGEKLTWDACIKYFL